jgi:hypothetical protein
MAMNCFGCRFNKNYGLPVHWCEGFVPGRLNLNYPHPFDDCPEGKKPSPIVTKLEDLW